MISLQNRLDHLLAFQNQTGTTKILEESISLQDLENELKDVTVSVTFWGTRSVTKPNCSGSVNLRWLACKVADISTRYPPAVIPSEFANSEHCHDDMIRKLCMTPERKAGRAVQTKIRQLFATSDEKLKNSFFARIFSAIREMFVYNTTRPHAFGFNIAGDPFSRREAGHLCYTPIFTRGDTKEEGVTRWQYNF